MLETDSKNPNWLYLATTDVNDQLIILGLNIISNPLQRTFTALKLSSYSHQVWDLTLLEKTTILYIGSKNQVENSNSLIAVQVFYPSGMFTPIVIS